MTPFLSSQTGSTAPWSLFLNSDWAPTVYMQDPFLGALMCVVSQVELNQGTSNTLAPLGRWREDTSSAVPIFQENKGHFALNQGYTTGQQSRSQTEVAQTQCCFLEPTLTETRAANLTLEAHRGAR